MRKRLVLLLLISTSFIFVSCEDKEDDKIFSAQQCMDAAANNPSIVDNCVAIVDGISTSKAYVIRCAADFIREGITNSTIVTAIENLDKNDGSQTTDPNVVLYDAFAFGSPSDPTAA
ncbi:MAG: hypothetical protein IT287_01540, partial [Bdellovibrionaceae bacterium]|nr:hypothetical protein [Pseudobdellovibrionaceae bacterium]